MDTYIIMKQKVSAICRHEPEPHLVVTSRKEAKERCIELERKAQTNQYWYQKVKNNFTKWAD